MRLFLRNLGTANVWFFYFPGPFLILSCYFFHSFAAQICIVLLTFVWFYIHLDNLEYFGILLICFAYFFVLLRTFSYFSYLCILLHSLFYVCLILHTFVYFCIPLYTFAYFCMSHVTSTFRCTYTWTWPFTPEFMINS